MNTPTPMRTPTPPPVYHSPTPAQTATPQATPTEMQTPTPANTATPMIFHSPTPMNTATPARTATPMRTPTPMSTATPMATATPMEAVGNVENIWNSTDVIQILGDIWNIVNEQKFYTHVNVELVDIHGDHSRYMFPGLIFNNQVQVSVSDGTSAAAIRVRWLHYVIEDNGHVIRFTPPLADRDPYTGRTVNPHAFATWIRRIP
jgi:hypothetical protein